MGFQPGNKLAVGGRREKPFRDALMIAIRETEGDRQKLRVVAEALVGKAVDGDVSAIKEIADRLDGKVPQAQILVGDDDGGPVKITRVEIVAADGHGEN